MTPNESNLDRRRGLRFIVLALVLPLATYGLAALGMMALAAGGGAANQGAMVLGFIALVASGLVSLVLGAWGIILLVRART